MEEQADRAQRLDEFAGLLAQHWERAGRADTAAGWYVRAGEAALAQGAPGVPVGTLRVLDLVAGDLNLMIYAPAGISMLCAGLAMWRSGLFVRALPLLALVCGAAFCVIGAALGAPDRRDLVDPVSSAALLFWVWMLWTGILLWQRRTARVETTLDRRQGIAVNTP